MNNREGATRELIIGLIIGVIVLGIAAYWMWLASQNAVPFMLAFGLPNNLIANLVILVILAVILGFAFNSMKKSS